MERVRRVMKGLQRVIRRPRRHRVAVEHPPPPPAMIERLSVVSSVRDNDMDAIRRKLTCGYHEASCREAVAALLAALATASLHVPRIDLIGHAADDGLLRIGVHDAGWTIDEDAVYYWADALAPLLTRLGTRELRLLGCSTASSERARRVLEAIAGVLDNSEPAVKVFGTTRLIDVADYDAAGFAAPAALWPEPALLASAQLDDDHGASAQRNPIS